MLLYFTLQVSLKSYQLLRILQRTEQLSLLLPLFPFCLQGQNDIGVLYRAHFLDLLNLLQAGFHLEQRGIFLILLNILQIPLSLLQLLPIQVLSVVSIKPNFWCVPEPEP